MYRGGNAEKRKATIKMAAKWRNSGRATRTAHISVRVSCNGFDE